MQSPLSTPLGAFSHESHFFVTLTGIRMPDEIFEPIHLDPAAREIEDVEHPLKGCSNISGCYLIYTFYDWGEGTSICPIYAGRAKRLSGRLCNHHNDDEGRILRFYEEFVDLGHMDISKTLKSGNATNVRPEELTRVAIWIAQDERERMFLEHGLIYTYRPTMNED